MAEINSSDHHQDPDVQLMLAVGRGDEQAFVELIHRHQESLVNFFVRMGVYNDAEDLVQETFVRLYKARAKYRPAAKFTTYLYVLARHVWADGGRKAKTRLRLEESLKTDAEIGGGAVTAEQGGGLDVQAALDSLTPKLREVVVLNIYQGLSYQEVADGLGIPLGTVKSRLNLAMQELRKWFDENGQ